ncbi:MAG: hypothetical protein ACAH95_05615 [Fimbriimonas sp.]
MDFDENSSRSQLTGFLLAMVTIGSLVAIGYAASRPGNRSKRLVDRLDKKLNRLEERLSLAR